MNLSPAITGFIAAWAGTSLIRLAVRKAGLGKLPKSDELLVLGVSNRVRSWSKWSGLLFAPLFLSIAYLCWTTFWAIARFRYSLLGPSVYVLTPDRVTFGPPSVFAGIFLAYMPMKIISTKFLGADGYQAFVRFENSRQRMNTEKVFRGMLYVIAPILTLYVLLSLQYYAVIDSTRFVIHPFFAVRERTYLWKDISQVSFVRSFRAPNGNIIENKPHFAIKMVDGFELDFHQALLDPTFAEQKSIASFVAANAHLPIIEINAY
jgi:hypothetical protein